MKILLTGSTSFIGKCLLKNLEESRYEIYHLVRTRKGLKNEFIWDFVSPLPEELPSCNVVIHLAVHVNFSLNLDIEQYNVNTVSTIKLTDYAKSCNAYFILASMAGVHGHRHLLIDKDTSLNPQNNYSMSKYLSEEIVKTFVDDYSILRICGVYGLDGPAHLGLNEAINNAVYKRIPPVLRGHGKAKRNYICVLDVARWILHLIQRFQIEQNSGKENIKETLYISTPEVIAIEDYLKIIVDMILPNNIVTRKAGNDSRDFIVKESPAPFVLTTFKQYICSLRTIN